MHDLEPWSITSLSETDRKLQIQRLKINRGLNKIFN